MISGGSTISGGVVVGPGMFGEDLFGEDLEEKGKREESEVSSTSKLARWRRERERATRNLPGSREY